MLPEKYKMYERFDSGRCWEPLHGINRWVVWNELKTCGHINSVKSLVSECCHVGLVMPCPNVRWCIRGRCCCKALGPIGRTRDSLPWWAPLFLLQIGWGTTKLSWSSQLFEWQVTCSYLLVCCFERFTNVRCRRLPLRSPKIPKVSKSR